MKLITLCDILEVALFRLEIFISIINFLIIFFSNYLIKVLKFLNKEINANIYYYVGYPQYNNARKNLHTIEQVVSELPFIEIEEALKNIFKSRLPRSACSHPYFSHYFPQSEILHDISAKLNWMETLYKQLAQSLEHLSKLLRCIYNILIYKT